VLADALLAPHRAKPHDQPAATLLRPSPTTTRARSRSAFSGGTIREAIVDVSGEQYVDLESEALAMMKRE
jgi:hypothetical protein